jgi:hypothetical protein
MSFRTILGTVLVVAAAGCGGNTTDTAKPAEPAPAAPAAAPAAPKPAGVVILTEPIEGAMGGHIDHFAWQPVDGADGYVVKIIAVTGNRTVWESQPMTTTETTLPTTVALEPEVHTWSVTARKGGNVIATSAVQKFTITP